MMDGHTEKHETELKDFFGNLDRKVDRTVDRTTKAHRDELTSFFSGLGPAVDIASRAQQEMDRRAATKFSIFDYFHERETDLSRIFAGLLDPSGAHGQGDRFLSLFLKEILPLLKETLPGYSPPSILHEYKVHLEYPTDKGRRIDIVLEMPDNHWIGIENKPWAEDGERQVEDYLKYLKKKSSNAWLLYLSGDGEDPKLSDESKLPEHCKTVPYRKNSNGGSLENWIEQCWRDCEAERVRWFLKDLLEYIHQKFEKENQVMVQDVIVDTTMEFILIDEKHLSLALQVEKAMPHVRRELFKRVMEEAKKHLKEWCKERNWDVVPLFDIYVGLRRKGWQEKNAREWDVGVVFVGDNQVKVHLPDGTDIDNFKYEFDKQVDQPTKEYTEEGSALIFQPYNLSETEEDPKRLMENDDIANELAEKMKEWATAVDNVCRNLKIEGGENSD